MTPRLSIVVVSLNYAADLERCLSSEFDCTHLQDLEVIAVDSGSSDGSPDVAQRFDVRLIANAENRGGAGGRNQRIAEAKADLVLQAGSYGRLVSIYATMPFRS